MGVAYVTLDNPPANSYDLSVMQRFAADVDAAITSDARAVIVRSASEKFFSAGADVKKFLDGEVEANMEMIRTSQAAFRSGSYRARRTRGTRERCGSSRGAAGGRASPSGGWRC